jgi:geranylgeranyl diphosphate synthase type II
MKRSKAVATISTYQNWIEREIHKQKYGNEPNSLYDPIRYLMALGGKRLRPMLTMLSYNLFQNNVRKIVPYAVAVEAFHNFTLMHDDIMDKAPVRRGEPTVHEKWNSNTAILSGDVMLVKVYDMFLRLSPDKLKWVLQAFNQCAAEVCEGQQWDMEFEQFEIVSERQYINMIKLKTAVLLGFSLELGGILGDASEADCRTLRRVGINIGIGFQLMDDLLDAYADPKKFGKQVGGDIIANKKTFLLIKALERAGGRQRSNLRKWIAAKKFRKPEKILAVKELYDALDIPALTKKKVRQFFEKGFVAMGTLQCRDDRSEMLRLYLEKLIARQS